MNWITTWSYLPLDYGCTMGTLQKITQRTVFWNNVQGTKAKIKFSNKYGSTILKMKEVVLSKESREGDQEQGHTKITLQGAREIVLLPGEEKYSDEVDFSVSAGTSLVLYIYFEEKVTVESSCCTWAKESWSTSYQKGGIGNQALGQDHARSHEVFPFIKDYMSEADVLVGVSEIRLLSEEKVQRIAMFGDSITHMSFYTDALMKALYQQFPGKVVVLNRGLGGNKLLTDATLLPKIPGEGRSSGMAGIKRFERDVYGDERPELVLVLLGINDLMHPYLIGKKEMLPQIEEMIKAYEEMASLCHEKGSQMYLGTLLPWKHEAIPFGQEGEQIRIQLNDWILHQRSTDGVFDFAKATKKDQETMKDSLHIGDGLHPNREGGIVMAQEVIRTGGIVNGINTD